MAELNEHVAYLSQEIGPRPAGTEEEQRAAHEKQMTESIGAEMGIEGFAGADYEGSIDLDLIQRAMDGQRLKRQMNRLSKQL